jgi:hypothetical protein
MTATPTLTNALTSTLDILHDPPAAGAVYNIVAACIVGGGLLAGGVAAGFRWYIKHQRNQNRTPNYDHEAGNHSQM